MIIINLNKAKNICHKKRREKRDKEFAPLDIKATIPKEAQEAEIARQSIRDKYSKIQENIDLTKNINELKTLISTLE